MGPAPSLTTYEQAAQSIYDPQKEAEAKTLETNRNNTVNTLEGGKGQITSDYQQAIDDLNSTVQKQVGQINQLYTQNLGGNFSGLQGNDLGMMFSSANKQAATIATTRANRLADISVQEANANNTFNTELGNLPSKYLSIEKEYANNAYGSAVKDYNTRQYQNQQLALSYAKLGASSARASSSAADKQASQYKVSGKKDSAGIADFGNGYSFTGPNGKPVSMSEYISGAGMGGQDVVDLLSNGSSYDRNVAKQVANSNPQNDQQLISAIKKADTGRYYGF